MARLTLEDGSRSPWIALDPKITEADIAGATRSLEVLVASESDEPSELPLDGTTATKDYARRWFDDREARGLTSVPSDRARFRTHVEPFLGATAIADVTKRQLEELVDALDAKARAGELAAKTAINVWGIVTKLFDDAHRGKPVAFQVRAENPARDVRGPERGSRLAKQFLYPSETTWLLACENVPLLWREFYAVALYTGLRPGELGALVVDDVLLDRKVINVKRAIDRATHAIKATKGKRARALPIEPSIAPLLHILVTRAGSDGQTKLLWTPPDERRATTLRNHLKRAGVTRRELHHSEPGRSMHITAHDLRSSTITWWAVRGDNPVTIQRRVGHEDLQTTDLYVRLAEALDPAAFGVPFPPLPPELLSASAAAPNTAPGALGFSSRAAGFSSPPPEILDDSWRREGDSNPW